MCRPIQGRKRIGCLDSGGPDQYDSDPSGRSEEITPLETLYSELVQSPDQYRKTGDHEP